MVFLVPDGGLFLARGFVLVVTIGVVGASRITSRAPLPLRCRMLSFYLALSTAAFRFWFIGMDMSGADENLVSPPSVDSWVTIFLCIVNCNFKFKFYKKLDNKLSHSLPLASD